MGMVDEVLLEEIARLDVCVKKARLNENLMGFYSADRHTIYLNRKLTVPQQRETLAHELAHAYYSHDCTNDRNEYQAWRRASLLIVDPDIYRENAMLFEYPEQIAQEMGLTPEIIKFWQASWLPQLLQSPRYMHIA